MDSIHEDKYSRFKLGQLWGVVQGTNLRSRITHLHNRVINEILKDDFNFNYKVTINAKQSKGSKNHLKDCTVLHFLYHNDVLDIDTFTTLIERGTDFTIKNGNGQTVVHLSMAECSKTEIQDQISFINAILSAHVKFQNFTNPHDNNGYSHLHGACMANHIEAVKFFLDNGASVDEAVNLDAPKYAGYSLLHFAVEFYSFEVVEILVSRGANVNAHTAKGETVLDLLIKNICNSQFPKENISRKDRVIKLLVEKAAVSAVGLSALHVACNLMDLTMAEKLLDEDTDIGYAVPMESVVCPGYTSLHFAINNGIEAVKMLLKRGADINIKNAYGQTPLDIFVDNYTLKDVCDTLSWSDNWKGIHLSDGQTKLLDLIAAMENLDKFQKFVENGNVDMSAIVPKTSVICPGNSILHFAVIFAKKFGPRRADFGYDYDKTIIEECLNRAVDVNVQNCRRQTAIHLAYHASKNNLSSLLLEHLDQLNQLVNVVDDDNLSYLYIVCSIKKDDLVEPLLRTSDPNIARKSTRSREPGYTPLHKVTFLGSHTVANMLLTHGANLQAADANGFTPIHGLVARPLSHNQQFSDVLFNELLDNLQDRVVDRFGLSYLHIACLRHNVELIEKLLDLGSDVNAVIQCDEPTGFDNHSISSLYLYSNLTPLQMVPKYLNGYDQIIDILLRRGADIFVKGSSKHSEAFGNKLPFQNKDVLRCFFPILWEREDMQKCMEERLGLTKLHIACYMKNEEAIRIALDSGINVNAQIYADAEMFAGCTPLHLLMTKFDNEPGLIESVMKLIIAQGADVTIENIDKDTPIHLFYKQQNGSIIDRFFDGDLCKNLLLNSQQNFSLNPTNAQGLSHFHIACHWHQIEIVEKFLQEGFVDVNQPTDYFAMYNAGSTPLHLVLNSSTDDAVDWTKLSQLVNLLLDNGADVTAKDVKGDTPLHKPAALNSPQMSIMDKLVSYGGDLKSENVHGHTPIEKLSYSNLSDNLMIFQKYGYSINGWNRSTGEGSIAKIFLSRPERLSEISLFNNFLESSDVKIIDNSGRTAIHNSIAISTKDNGPEELENYIYAIQSFMNLGIDIDHQDESGQTALHYAARVENFSAVKALLFCGADVNIIDSNKKSAFSYAAEHSEIKDDVRYLTGMNYRLLLRLHMKKLQHLNIEISQLNEKHLECMEHFIVATSYTTLDKDYRNPARKFFDQIEQTKIIEIGTNSLTLFDFLSDMRALTMYPLLQKIERDLVDDFFKSADLSELQELAGIVKLQFRKMILRLEFLDSAFASLRKLLGFSVPGLCEQISRFLFNSDFMNLIESTKLDSIEKKFSEISS